MSSLESAAIVKLPVFVVAILYARYLSAPYRLILCQAILALIIEAIGWYIAVKLHRYNIWLFNIFGLIDFWLVGTAGYLLIKNRIQRSVIPYAMTGASLLWAGIIWQQGLKVYPTWALSFIGIVVVYIYLGVLAGTIFRSNKLWLQPDFWLSISIILFYSCTIPLYTIFNYLIRYNLLLLEKLFNIVMVLNIIRYPLVALSLYLYGRYRQKTLKAGNNVF